MMTFETLPATAFKWPAVLLSGVVDYDMYMKFRSQFDEAWGQDLAIVPAIGTNIGNIT